MVGDWLAVQKLILVLILMTAKSSTSLRIVPSRNGKVLREAILKVYNDRALCNKLGENARKRIATVLNHTQAIEKTKKMYEDLFKSN